MPPTAAATSISDLPEPLLHRILSDLPYPTTAVICTMSKRLYSAWNNNPRLHFEQFYHPDLWRFASYVKSTIRRRQRGIKLEELRLTFTEACDWLCREAMDYAVAHGVEELQLTLAAAGLPYPHLCRYHEFPVSLLRAETLRVLTLQGLRWRSQKMETGGSVTDSDKASSATGSNENGDRVVAELTLSYPLLEAAKIGCCVGIENLRMVSCRRLKTLSLWNCIGLKRVWFDTSSYSVLESVWVSVCGEAEAEARVEYEGNGPGASQVEVHVRKGWV